jgi:hypothetical protein
MTDLSQSDYVPALSAAERYHLEVYGYVVLENTLEDDLTARLREALLGLKGEFLAQSDLDAARVRRCGLHKGGRPHHLHFTHILESAPVFLEYLSHPRILSLTEELVGGSVRLEESEAIVNSRDPEEPPQDPPRYGFHRGTEHGVGPYEENGLLHGNFVKVLTNLTDLGPDDGGTTVIAGSHKLKLPAEEMIAAAYENPALIHQVEAPAGSSLLFTESLIHASGVLRSDRERCIIIGGYTPPMFQVWPGQEPSDEFVASLPEALRPLISGSESWNWRRRCRSSLRG